MKKVYVKPQTEVVEIGTESLLAGSTVSGTEDGAVGAPRKKRNVWDEETDDFLE